MSRQPSERITVRLSEKDMAGLKKIQQNAELDEVSSAVRFCINFTLTMFRLIPAALIETFLTEQEQEQIKK